MADSTLTGLPEVTSPDAEALLYSVTPEGVDAKVKLENLIAGLPIATLLNKGLMSAADKVALDNAVAALAVLQSPLTATIASSVSIVVPASTFQVILTGTTTVTAVVGLANYRTYTFFYPAGAGLTFMGQPLLAGDIIQFTQIP